MTPVLIPDRPFSIDVEVIERTRDLKDALAHISASGKGESGDSWRNPEARAGLESILLMWQHRECTKDDGKQLSARTICQLTRK